VSAHAISEVRLPERYELIRHLANGGMASVWCAEDLLLNRRVAIKLLAEELDGEDPAARRFIREARAAARLSSHPHVVTIYDIGECDGRGFIVMEHLAGGSVADAIRAGIKGPAPLVLRWLREAAEALDHAHRHGVIHRDVKPGNLLLDADRVLHVADFGIARLASEAAITDTGHVLGSAGYLSPEQVLGRPATDASDRYALAVTAFELLTGRRPFVAEHLAAQVRLQVDGEPPRASQVAPGLPLAVDAVLVRGMAKRPRDRWPTCVALVDALERALAEAGWPVTARAAAAIAAGQVTARRSGDATAGPATVGTATRVGDERVPRLHRAGALTPPRLRALGAMAAVAFALGAVAGAGAGPTGSRRTRIRQAAAVHHARGPARPAAATASTSGSAATGIQTPTTAQSRTTVPPGPAPGADALEAQGHQLMTDGSYLAAIGILRKAVSTAAPGSLTRAFALYDLGRSLRLAGDPQAAIPILRARLQIPNQTGIVQHELALAIAQASASATPPAPASGDGHGKGHGKHGSGDGGGDQSD
jgi:serine/threonine-protein kinase